MQTVKYIETHATLTYNFYCVYFGLLSLSFKSSWNLILCSRSLHSPARSLTLSLYLFVRFKFNNIYYTLLVIQFWYFFIFRFLMPFNQLFKRLWTRHIELSLVVCVHDSLFFSLCTHTHTQCTWDVIQARCLFWLERAHRTIVHINCTKSSYRFYFFIPCFNLINVIVGSLLLNFMVFVANGCRLREEY